MYPFRVFVPSKTTLLSNSVPMKQGRSHVFVPSKTTLLSNAIIPTMLLIEVFVPSKTTLLSNRERLSYAWLLRQLLLRGIEIPKATLSAYLRGDRYGGENADKVIRACIDILKGYEKGLYGE